MLHNGINSPPSIWVLGNRNWGWRGERTRQKEGEERSLHSKTHYFSFPNDTTPWKKEEKIYKNKSNIIKQK